MKEFKIVTTTADEGEWDLSVVLRDYIELQIRYKGDPSEHIFLELSELTSLIGMLNKAKEHFESKVDF